VVLNCGTKQGKGRGPLLRDYLKHCRCLSERTGIAKVEKDHESIGKSGPGPREEATKGGGQRVKKSTGKGPGRTGICVAGRKLKLKKGEGKGAVKSYTNTSKNSQKAMSKKEK